MNRFTLYCVGDGFPKGKWQFEPSKSGMNVSDPDGVIVCWFPHHEADERFILPSFWGSVKNIGLKTDGGSTIWFDPDSRAVARVKTYLDESIASQGMVAVQGLRRKGWRNLLTGLGLVLFGFVALGLLREVVQIQGSNKYYLYPFVALALFGAGQTALAVTQILRAGRAKRALHGEEQSG